MPAETWKNKDETTQVVKWNSGGKHIRRSCSCRKIDLSKTVISEAGKETSSCGNDGCLQTEWCQMLQNNKRAGYKAMPSADRVSQIERERERERERESDSQLASQSVGWLVISERLWEHAGLPPPSPPNTPPVLVLYCWHVSLYHVIFYAKSCVIQVN